MNTKVIFYCCSRGECKYPDRIECTLRKPNYQFSGKIGVNVLFSIRFEPALFGLGLIEAIEEESFWQTELFLRSTVQILNDRV